MEHIKQSKPTENEVFGLTQDQVEELRKNAIERLQRSEKRWVQRGPYLVCITDSGEVATHIGTAKILVGLDDKGNPMFKQVNY
jgi:hypothetical protein